jgi:RNA polymerase sigma-70 factor (ECF subfamily)
MLPTSVATDAHLAERTRLGDVDALGELYSRYSARVMSLALRFTGERADAEDVVHDVFLGLPEALRRYEEQGALEAWLKRLTVRVALTRMRTDRRRRESGLGEDVARGISDTDQVAATSVLDRAIRELPESLRIVFVLKEIEGYSHADIASTLGISSGASEVRLSRAMRLLRLRLGNNR